MSNYKKTLVTTLIVLMLTAMIVPLVKAELVTDKDDYAPTDPVVLTGTGFEPESTVHLTLTGPEGFTAQVWDVTANSTGGFTYTYTGGLIYGTFTLVATDGITTQTTTFTDAVVNVLFRIEGLVSTTKSVSYSGTNNGGNPVSGSASITTDATGTGTATQIGLKELTQVTFTFPSVTGYTFIVNASSPYTLPSGGTPTPSVYITAIYSPVSVNTAPSGVTFSGATINEGDIYNATVTFTDPDTDTWTATVDFGDGSSTVTYNNVAKSGFDIHHTYKDNNDMPDNDPFTVTVTIDDGHVGGTGSGTAEVTVNNVRPTVGAITIDPAIAVVKVGETFTASADFTDPGILDWHTASWDWNLANPGIDTTVGTIVPSPMLSTHGSVSDTHSYSTAGIYTLQLTVTDKDGDSGTSTFMYVVVYDPNAGFVTGGGWINSPARAYTADPTLTGKATFGFVSQYKKGANVPMGNTEFQFQAGDLNFKSTSYQWLVVTGGNRAQFKGVGTINGEGTYNFMIWAQDGGAKGADTFRIQITDSSGTTIYDNGVQQSITGSIVVH